MSSALNATDGCAGQGQLRPVTVNYGDITESGSYQFPHIWDLTLGDLILSYKVDMSEYTPPMGQTAWTSIGLMDRGGVKSWMSSGAPYAAETNPNSLDIDDKHQLLHWPPGYWDEREYDATDPNTVINRFGTYDNYGIWFDRDGVNQSQADMWGMIDGRTYNTGGIYEIVVRYHAINENLGTMFATVNGIPTGFYTAGLKNAQPEIYPAGMSFTGDMTMLKVWADVPVYEVDIYDLTAEGCLTLIPENAIFLLEDLKVGIGKFYAVKNPEAEDGQREALCNKVDAVIGQVEAGAYNGAINKLENDVKDKIEKWIEDPTDLISKVNHIISVLETL